MQAENAPSAEAGSADHPKKSRVGLLILYLIGVAVLFASAIILTIVTHSSEFFWPMTLLGAVVITALVSAAALPELRRNR